MTHVHTQWQPPKSGRFDSSRMRLVGLVLYMLLLIGLILVASTVNAASSDYGYERRPVNITVYKGISPYGTNSDDVLNHCVIDLTRGRSARLEGLQVSVVGNEVLEDATGVNIGTFYSVVGGRMTGIQLSAVSSVAGDDVSGIQIGGLAAVNGGDVRFLQVGGLGAVSGGEMQGVQLSAIAAVAGDDVTGIQAAGLASISGGDGGLVQIGGLAAVSGENATLQAGGLSAISGGDVRGGQLSALASITGGSMVGVQAAGLSAISGGKVIGLQAGGLAAIAGGSVTGVQVSGLASVAEGPVRGLQLAALANVAEENHFAQIGSINASEYQKGAQIGLVNVASEGHLVQLGLANVLEEGRGLQIGFFNALAEEKGVLPIGPITRTPDGPEKVDLWYDGIGTANLGYRTGTSRISSLLFAGFKSGDTNVWTLGMGTGYKFDVIDYRGKIEIEGVWQTLNEGEFWSENPHWIASARLLWSWQFTDRFGLFIGPSYNYYYSLVNDGSNILPTAADAPSSPGDAFTQNYVTIHAGVRIF